MFTDRMEAGKQLALKLADYRGKDVVVLALPRGGVVMGYEIARALSCPLDIIVTRKIGHPLDPEYAIGSVDERGISIMNAGETAMLDASWLRDEIERQSKEARRRSVAYRHGRKPIDYTGKIVIIVDDGIATGLTMRLAVRSAKAAKPKKIIVAVPVGAEDSLCTLRDEGADETIVLVPPEEFKGAVGAHYAQFEQVEDKEVIAILDRRDLALRSGTEQFFKKRKMRYDQYI